MEGEDYQVYSG